MMEDCATRMSAPHGCNDDTAVIESFKEALTGRVGAERFRMWFTHGVTIAVDTKSSEASESHVADEPSTAGTSEQNAGTPEQNGDKAEQTRCITLLVRGQFALDRLRHNFIREMRGAAMQACGVRTEVVLQLDEPAAKQAQLPLTDDDASGERISTDGEVGNADAANAAAVSGVHPPHPTTGGQPSEQSLPPHTTQSRGQRNGRLSKVPSKRGRTQSIAAYIGGNSGAKPRQNSHSLRIDQAEQLEFPGLDQTSRSQTSRSQTKATSASTPSAASDVSPAKISPGSGIHTARKQAPQQTDRAQESKQPATVANFIAGTSNQLAYTALSMVCQDPKTASPIFFCGPTGTGKTHLMSAIADQLRRRHRMRRVMHLSAEQFTNDFISSVGNSGITAFRRRYREVDALLIDDVQFLGAKKATLREMLYTVETLGTEGRALIFSGLQSPSEIPGLSHELAGRMASGLVCPLQPLDIDIRRKILERWIAERCPLEVPAALLDQINPMLAGDGRVVSGVANMIGTLQRMFGRVPTLDEIRQFGGNLLRASTPIATLSVIETAVCDAFHLPHHTLRGRSQTRAVTGPRMLAMYLARQLTASAYSEIASHFGGKSHSTAISAENNVKKWLENGKSIGRGQLAMSTREAVARVENLLRSG